MKRHFQLLFILICALPITLLAACGTDEDTASDKANDEVTEVEDSTESKEKIIISTAKDFVTEQESEAVEHPESEQDYQIVKNDEEVQIIISDYTGRMYKNVHYVSGSFTQNDNQYDYEILLSWGDSDFKEPLLLKYTSDTGANYTLEEASIYFVEEDAEKDLEEWDFMF
ncbi:hypothetical protein [Gracilibacillus xinjiangensis]|uniref:Uncharacterized protein n=1 Tax=Gracilibacillus xinjiangensis TaxID=1193282 RepID=A0ABV8WWW8_9BACI